MNRRVIAAMKKIFTEDLHFREIPMYLLERRTATEMALWKKRSVLKRSKASRSRPTRRSEKQIMLRRRQSRTAMVGILLKQRMKRAWTQKRLLLVLNASGLILLEPSRQLVLE